MILSSSAISHKTVASLWGTLLDPFCWFKTWTPVPFGWTRLSYMTWPSWAESWFGPKWKAPKNKIKNKKNTVGVVKRFQNFIILSYLNNPQSCVICHFNSRYWWLINIYFFPFFESFLHLKKIKISCLLNYVCGMIYDTITHLGVCGVAIRHGFASHVLCRKTVARYAFVWV